MKVRAGFVSNSSSSAFLIALPHMPKSAEELKDMMFGDKKVWIGPYMGKHSTLHTASVLFEVLKDVGKANKKQLREWFENDDGAPHSATWDKPDNMSWDEWEATKEYKDALKTYEKDLKTHVATSLAAITNKHKGMSFFIIEIGDGGGSGHITDGDMEYSKVLWKKIPTIRVSHH